MNPMVNYEVTSRYYNSRNSRIILAVIILLSYLFSLALLLKTNLAYINNSVENTWDIGSLEHALCLTRGKGLIDKYFETLTAKNIAK